MAMSFIWLLWQGITGLVYVWWISIPFVIVLILSIYLYRKNKRKFPKELTYSLTYPISLPIFISVVGAIFFDTDSDFAAYTILAAFLIGVVEYLVLLIKLKNYRMFVFSLVGLLLELSFWVMFVSGMSIANDWI